MLYSRYRRRGRWLGGKEENGGEREVNELESPEEIECPKRRHICVAESMVRGRNAPDTAFPNCVGPGDLDGDGRTLKGKRDIG